MRNFIIKSAQWTAFAVAAFVLCRSTLDKDGIYNQQKLAGICKISAETNSRLDERDWTGEHRCYIKRIITDLKAAGLPLPKIFIPFPNENSLPPRVMPDDPPEGYYDFVTHTMVGITGDGPMYYSVINPYPVDSSEGRCPDSKFLNDSLFEMFRDLTIVHEMAHYIDSKLQITDPIAIKIKEESRAYAPLEKSFIRTNARERYADMTAVLYLLSNMPDNYSILNATYQLRLASPEDDEHDTASSIQAAYTEYHKHPRPHLSIVKAARWSGRLLDQYSSTIALEEAVMETGLGYVSPTARNITQFAFMGKIQLRAEESLEAWMALCGKYRGEGESTQTSSETTRNAPVPVTPYLPPSLGL